MSNTELIKELRALTQAGMKDCREALEEAGWDLQKAVDVIKVKGQNIGDGRSGRVASEGRVAIMDATNLFDKNGSPLPDKQLRVMVEVNSQTDFVANSKEFANFADSVAATLLLSASNNQTFNALDVEQGDNGRLALVSKIKENIVVRRWWVEEAFDPRARVFSYKHSNAKIGVLLTLMAPTPEAANDPAFVELGNDLAMQVAAMNPLAVSHDRLHAEDVSRQKSIFETQLAELNKPQAAWPKIMDGKLNKWYTEVCLLNQESVIVPKTTVQQVVKNVGTKLGGEIQVVSFIRCQVGEGLEIKKENLADEVAKIVKE